MATLITAENVAKKFTDAHGKILPALEKTDLKIERGSFFMLLGPSGCGKSTLLRILSGLETDHEGKVTYATGLKPEERSFVFQQFALLPWLTVEENVGIGLAARGIEKGRRKKRVLQELKTFNLERFKDHFPHELSGGMRQRVGIARALATDPKLLFLDEPFSELDSFIAEELRKNLLHIWQERQLTIVMVSHNIQETLLMADQIAVMTARPGKIEKLIKNPLPRPRERRSEAFFNLEDKIATLIKP